eukprot:CAMPEP_0181252576 /NCGR_PEP_ID=MMETSP1096-20121128/47541_1 /TAXON_ID=156174 ORGANISM="Chrysochromulina ericina, Strain CCMP281" /NCGR_SAMPLE_ID=MMETSP1096 /ASSEMBLY_ACC=CAM_ASM_000453 /LENGTH=161 /DNA_ID=CAMNT_0023350349 /DNA_START=70 /DNA_END=555 /DNA_ORIENTATION=+
MHQRRDLQRDDVGLSDGGQAAEQQASCTHTAATQEARSDCSSRVAGQTARAFIRASVRWPLPGTCSSDPSHRTEGALGAGGRSCSARPPRSGTARRYRTQPRQLEDLRVSEEYVPTVRSHDKPPQVFLARVRSVGVLLRKPFNACRIPLAVLLRPAQELCD